MSKVKSIYHDEQDKLDRLEKQKEEVENAVSRVLDNYDFEIIPYLDGKGAPKVLFSKRLRA